MKDSRRADFLLAFSLAIIFGTMIVYVALIRRWLSADRAAPSAATIARPAPPDPQRLVEARLKYRRDFLEPSAALRLSEALNEAGRPIDAFYVMMAAREFFGDEAFLRAHAFVVVHKSRHFLGGRPFDGSAANEARLKERLGSDPTNPELLLYLARIAAARRAPVEAHKYLDLGLTAQPQDPGLQSLKAELQLVSDPLSAIGQYARLINAQPDAQESRGALEMLARLAQGSEDGPAGESVRLSREALEELLKARPDHPLIFTTQAMSLWARGQREGAAAMAAAAAAKSPRHAGAAAVEGALELEAGRVDKALARLSAAWEANPEDLYSASKLAEIYYKQRSDPEAALPYYLALYRRNPLYDDGEPAERLIRRTLDVRRAQLLKLVAAEGLGRHLRSDDASLRAEACVRAAELKDPRWIEELAELLDDDAEIVRHNADYALYQLAKRFPDAVRVRRDEWLGAARPLLRVRALNLFADLDRGETFPLVSRALYDEDPAVRYLAKTMVLDRYYADSPAAQKAARDALAREKDPRVLALYARPPRPEASAP